MEEHRNGIVRKNGYTFWRYVSIVDDYIFEFIRNKFPDSLIIPEFQLVDWTVINENLPIEIQSTIINTYGSISHSMFEEHIQKQLEQNIKIFKRCWFFFDAEYLRYLQNVTGGTTISINLDWFYKLMKEEKLKVFTVTWDGEIEERNMKEFEFIKNLSMTCELGMKDDSKILEQNLFKIANNVFNYYGITTEEMRKLRKQFNERDDTKYHFREWLRRDDSSNREKMISDIYRSIFCINMINICFDCKLSDDKYHDTIFRFGCLGLTEKIHGRNQYAIKRFVDLPKISQYFPGYIRNKEKWDYLKDSKMNLNPKRLSAIVTGKVNPLDWKKLIHAGW